MEKGGRDETRQRERDRKEGRGKIRKERDLIDHSGQFMCLETGEV